MITNRVQLAAAEKRLRQFQAMLESTRQHLQETNSPLFTTASEGYLRRIETLQDEITTYLRERPAETALSVKIAGPTLPAGIIKAATASKVIGGLQTALNSVGKTVLQTEADEEGMKTKGLGYLFNLDLVATGSGSFVIALDIPSRFEPALFEEYDLASRAVEQLISHVKELKIDPAAYSGNRSTLRGLQNVTNVVRKDIESIEVAFNDEVRSNSATVDSIIKERVDYLLGNPREGERTVRGKLIEINVEDNKCKVHPENEVAVVCDYEDELEDDLISALKKQIVMAGQFQELNQPGRYKITRIERFRVVGTDE